MSISSKFSFVNLWICLVVFSGLYANKYYRIVNVKCLFYLPEPIPQSKLFDQSSQIVPIPVCLTTSLEPLVPLTEIKTKWLLSCNFRVTTTSQKKANGRS